MDGLAEDYLFRMSAGETADTGGLSPLARLVHRIMDRAIAGRDAAVAVREAEAAAVAVPPATPPQDHRVFQKPAESSPQSSNTRTTYIDADVLNESPSAAPSPQPAPTRSNQPPLPRPSDPIPSNYLRSGPEPWRGFVGEGGISTTRRSGPPGSPPKGW
jgi:hypothetical protein